jgi:hypothetical protein
VEWGPGTGMQEVVLIEGFFGWEVILDQIRCHDHYRGHSHSHSLGPISLLAVVMIVPHWRVTNPTTRMESKKRAEQRTQADVLADEEVPGRRRSE